MEISVENQFSNELLLNAARRFGLKEEGLELLGKFENYVYEGEKDGKPYILRLVHSSHRDVNKVLGELDWVKFLGEKGLNVAKPLPSIDENLVEVIPVEEDYFIASLFEKAVGKLVDPTNQQEWNQNLFENWGSTIGKIHRMTKEYTVPKEEIKRPQWDQEDLLNLEKYIDNEDQQIIEISKELVLYLNALPKDQDSYGLIHTDIHFRNFFAHNGEITVFDFDDCSYQWFISDIAIALYYSVWWCTSDKSHAAVQEFSEWFLGALLEGYKKENTLDEFWLTQLPYFLRLRDIVLYSVLHKKFDMNNLNDRQLNLLKEIRERIITKTPIVDMLND